MAVALAAAHVASARWCLHGVWVCERRWDYVWRSGRTSCASLASVLVSEETRWREEAPPVMNRDVKWAVVEPSTRYLALLNASFALYCIWLLSTHHQHLFLMFGSSVVCKVSDRPCDHSTIPFPLHPSPTSLKPNTCFQTSCSSLHTFNGKSMDYPTLGPSRPECGTELCMSHVQVLISVHRSPDPTYSRTSRPYFPTNYARIPTGRISYLPELLLCAMFCHAARSSCTAELAPS